MESQKSRKIVFNENETEKYFSQYLNNIGNE